MKVIVKDIESNEVYFEYDPRYIPRKRDYIVFENIKYYVHHIQHNVKLFRMSKTNALETVDVFVNVEGSDGEQI